MKLIALIQLQIAAIERTAIHDARGVGNHVWNRRCRVRGSDIDLLRDLYGVIDLDTDGDSAGESERCPAERSGLLPCSAAAGAHSS